MRPPPSAPAAIAALALGGLLACSPDSISSPAREQDPLMNSGSGGTKVLTVDDDLADCPRADFTTVQAAVAAAQSGTTIQVCAGTYHEQVTITKDELRLIAVGMPGEVVLDGLDLHDMFAGFLLDDAHGSLIQGFVVQNYHEANILLANGSSRNTIRKNVARSASHHDGIQLSNAPGNVIELNQSSDNFSPGGTACGINVAGPGSVGNIVRHNETFGNDFGVQIAGGAADNVVFHNESHDNRKFGIRTIGGPTGTVIENNRAVDNAGPGIALLLGSSATSVVRNKAFDNDPDLFWDGTGAGNTFDNNHCRTSVPAGLCEHTEGGSNE
ncbi:MAG: right-handed parallel beta-helix repeat-containing protein [Longimicrobiales bacterium]